MTAKKAGATLGALGLLVASIVLMGTSAALRPTDGEVEALVLQASHDVVVAINDAGDAVGVVADDSLTMAADQVAALPPATEEVVNQLPAVAQNAADTVDAGAAAVADMVASAPGTLLPATDHAAGSAMMSLGKWQLVASDRLATLSTVTAR